MDNDKDKDKDKDKRGDRAFRNSKLMNTGRCVRTVGVMQTNQMKNRNHNEGINTKARSSNSSSVNAAESFPSHESRKRSRSIQRDPS